MQSDQHQLFPQKQMLPLADQMTGGYPVAPIFGELLSPTQKNLIPFHGVDVQSSEACPRNFIIFDQTDEQSQIMFNPAIAPKYCYPSLNFNSPSFPDNAKRNSVNHETEISFFKENSDDIDALLSSEEEVCDEEEVSTARTYGNYESDSSDSCTSHGSRPRNNRLPSFSQKSTGSGSNCSGRKRHKMRKMVKTLRKIVPGSNQMNTAAVLEEAVSYLKSLKVEVQKLGVGNLKS